MAEMKKVRSGGGGTDELPDNVAGAEGEEEISAHADGGPRSRVCSRDTPAQPPIDFSGNFSAHVSAK